MACTWLVFTRPAVVFPLCWTGSPLAGYRLFCCRHVFMCWERLSPSAHWDIERQCFPWSCSWRAITSSRAVVRKWKYTHPSRHAELLQGVHEFFKVCSSQNFNKKTTIIKGPFITTVLCSWLQSRGIWQRKYCSMGTKLIADVLNHSFVTSTQANVTSIGPSKTTDANIKQYFLTRQINCVFITNYSWKNTHTL